MSTYVIEYSDTIAQYVIEYAHGTGPQGPSGGAGLDVLSYGEAQQLDLTELRTVRRNLIQGSAPTLAYDGNGRLSTITYSDGSVKTLTYTDGLLTQIDHVYSSPARTYRKVLVYDNDDRLELITESIL
jgi:YD repeat-containing protein